MSRDWHAMQVGFVRRRQFRCGDPAILATYTLLGALCADEENAGRIAGARQLDDAGWAAAAGAFTDRRVIAALVAAGGATWDGDTLVLVGYDVKGEELLARKRAGGVDRWRRHRDRKSGNGQEQCSEHSSEHSGKLSSEQSYEDSSEESMGGVHGRSPQRQITEDREEHPPIIPPHGGMEESLEDSSEDSSEDSTATVEPEAPAIGSSGIAAETSLVLDPAPVAPKVSKRQKSKADLRQHQHDAVELYEYMSRLRKWAHEKNRVRPPVTADLVPICAILAAGYSVDDCRHVLRVRAAEAKRGGPGSEALKYFNGVSTWRPDNFRFALEQPDPGDKVRAAVIPRRSNGRRRTRSSSRCCRR